MNGLGIINMLLIIAIGLWILEFFIREFIDLYIEIKEKLRK